MDEGKATGPKPKWWNRPVTRPGGRSPSEAEPKPAEDATAGDSVAPGAVDGASASPVPSVPSVPSAGGRSPADNAVGDAVAGGGRDGASDRPAEPAERTGAQADAAAADATAEPGTAAADADVAGSQHEASSQPEAVSQPEAGRPGAESTPGPQAAVHPLHEPDPYSTPPYGGPGPWAPAPPVQRPMPTPAHGTHLPPGLPPAATPAHGTHLPPAVPQAVPPPGMTPAHGTQLPPGAPADPGAATAQLPQQPGQPPQPQPGPPQPGQPLQSQPGGPLQPQPGQAAQWQHYDPWTSAPSPDAPRKAPRRRGLAGAVLIALIAGCLGGGIGAYLEHERAGEGSAIHLPQAPAEDEPRDPDSVAGIAAGALPGVVTIHVSGGTEQATGTGFVLDKQGHILTNNHVVEPAGAGGDISVTFSGGEVADAKVVGRDSGYDLAVIKVEGVSGLHPLPLGNSDSVRVGDPVVAIGAPYDLAGTVTSGIISAKERPITAGGEQGDGSDISYVDALQTDAPINPGNSGGPLVDSKGRVIGINSAIRAADDGSGADGGQGGSIGLGFAIPINQGKRVAEELINTGKATHPVIGVTLDMEYTGDGARVHTRGAGGPPVTPGGPGDKAGIEAGDVITEVDGVRVHSGQELIVKIRSHRPGDRLRLTLRRDGGERTVELTLGSAGGSG
ncbi:trypsin-like peptidase domain-containing protein [Streptomyces sparsogenes]|uniref:trypsin-like peptidase domain-containing protein n=1 Tax=Streptomyces sparsogenes TaxID=67365 RepID=UPI003402C3E7